MSRSIPLRVLVIDDVGLIGDCVAARLRRAAEQSDLAECKLGTIETLTIRGGDEGRSAAADIQAAIFEHDINVLVTDRGIVDAIEEKKGASPEKSKIAYYRSGNPQYDHIEMILSKLSADARRRIKFVLIYTFDDPESGNPWYVDINAVRASLRQYFDHGQQVDVIKTHHEVYSETGLKLFNTVPGDPKTEFARGADLQLYGAIVGEMAWRHISGASHRRDAAHRFGLRRWLIQNYFIFAFITFGLGVGVSTAYDLLKATVLPGALLIVSVTVGLIVPFLLLLSNPQLLMLPGAEKE